MSTHDLSPTPLAPDDFRVLLAHHGRDHWWGAGMRKIAGALLGEVHGRVLDAGCGPGWMLRELPAHAQGVGLDRHLPAVVVQTRWPGRALALGDVARLPFDCAFDLVMATDLLEQRGVDPACALAEFRRVVVPGGRLLIRVPAGPRLYGARDAYWGGARRYTRPELAGFVSGAGFRILRLTHANSLLYPLGVASRMLSNAGRTGANDLQPMPRAANRLLQGLLEIEAAWLRRHDIPFGLSLLCLAERPLAAPHPESPK